MIFDTLNKNGLFFSLPDILFNITLNPKYQPYENKILPFTRMFCQT